jgi:hypothetical protein
MGVGNVGQSLMPYKESDTFLSRDGGFTWEEIRKDAHLWEFGDSGSILVLVNDEEPTNKLLFSTDEGTSWREYDFQKTLRIKSLRNAPSDTSRKFVMFGHSPTSSSTWSAVHVDFTALTSKKCEWSVVGTSNTNDWLFIPQASWILTIPRATISNCGARRNPDRRSVFSAARYQSSIYLA